ncbi:hypothetical protein AC1031_000912 [Aphanomyces cochlioides]|nr:hypothetical protein AC1031_000912 [Aphanomyces cochlioides]
MRHHGQMTTKKFPAVATLNLSDAGVIDPKEIPLSNDPAYSPRTSTIVERRRLSEPNTFVREVIAFQPTSNTPRRPPGLALHDHCDSSVDIVSSTETMKHVFSMPYTSSPRSVAIHRVGRKLVVGTRVESESQRISRRYKKNQAPKQRHLVSDMPVQRSPTRVGNPFFDKDWDYDEEDMSEEAGHRLVTDPETGEIFLVCDDDIAAPTLEDKAQANVQHDLHDRFLHDALSRASFPLELTITETTHPSLLHPSSFQQLVRWQFNSIELLMGSNTVIFKHNTTDELTSVRLHDDQSKLTSLVCLDTWLDNVMNNLHQTAFCFHRDGHVQGYQMVRTEDLPFVQEPAIFDAHTVFHNAQSILLFLQHHCVDEAQTYWLTKAPQGSLHLFQLPSKVSTTADHTVGMLCYELANSIAVTPNEIRRVRRLYSKCIQLVDAKARPDVIARACLSLGNTFIQPHVRAPGYASGLLRGDADASLRTKAMLDELSAALDACETFAKQDQGKPKIASLFEIAQRYIPKTTTSHAAEFMATPPPLLDDEAQEKEDFEQALIVFAEGTTWADDDESTMTHLLDGVRACYYVLAQKALDEVDLGTALSYAHSLLNVLSSYQFPQVNLLVAKIHLRLAATTTNIEMNRTGYTTATRTKPHVKAFENDATIPAWVHMSRNTAEQWISDCELHLTIAVSSAMHMGTSKAHLNLPLLSVSRDQVHQAFRQLLRDAYVSQTRYFVTTGRHTKGARHAEQGLVLFSSLEDAAAGIEMRVLLGEIALRHASQSSGYHKAIGAFTQALSDLTRQEHETMENEWAQALHIHVLLLLRFAHAQHALHLQEGLSKNTTSSVDDQGEWTAAQSAVRDELQQCLTYSQHALELNPTSSKILWRVADANYLLASLYASHVGSLVDRRENQNVALMELCISHYDKALKYLPLTFDSCVHHLLLRLDTVKFLLTVGTKIESKLEMPPTVPAQWLALRCLVDCAPLYILREEPGKKEDNERIKMLRLGLFRLVEQQAHGCMKQLIKMKHPHADAIKRCYLAWIQDAPTLLPHEVLARAAQSLDAFFN